MSNHKSILLAAQGDPDAISEVLQGKRYEGAIEEIQPLTQIVDKVGIMFITGTAFLIITVAIWRNVLAGAYAAFPRFWDQVHDAHDEVKDQGWLQRIQGIRGNAASFNMSSLKRMMMRIVPDIKVLTDFEDDTVEPKTYFTKAIAQMIAVVMIGVFIYNGYYRDVTIQVASFGSEIFQRTIMGVDPVEVFDRVLNTAGMPEFSTDNALDTAGKRKNEVSKLVYKKLITKYTDISTAEDKAKVAAGIETNINAWLDSNAVKQYLTKDQWKMSVDCTLTTNETTLKSKTTSSDKNMVSFAKSWNTDTFQLNTTKFTDETWYVTAVVVFQKTNIKNKDMNFYDVQMTVDASVDKGNKVWKFTTKSGEGMLRGTATFTVDDVKYKCEVKDDGLHFTNDMPSKGGTFTLNNSLLYECGTQEDTITTMKISTNGKVGTPVFSSSSAAEDVQLGKKLQAQTKSDSDVDSN